MLRWLLVNAAVRLLGMGSVRSRSSEAGQLHLDGFHVDRELPAGQDRRAWITLLAIVASLTVSCSTLRNIPVLPG